MFRTLSVISRNCRSCNCKGVVNKLSSRGLCWSNKGRFAAGLLFGRPVVSVTPISVSVRYLSASSSVGSRWSAKIDGMAESDKKESSVTTSPSQGVGEGVDRSKCIFCKIVDGKESNEIYYQDDDIVVFQDIRPAAKYHFLVVTREHIKDCKTLGPSQLGLVDRLTQVGNQVLQEQMQKDGGGSPEQVQKLMGFHWPPFHTVSHLHLHVIAPSNQMGFISRTVFRPGIWFVTADYVRERLEKMSTGESK